MTDRRRNRCFTAIALAGIILVSGAPRLEAAPQVPLVHLTAVQTSCAQAFPAIPGRQHCYSTGFYWYGKTYRTHVLELGTDFPDLCPPELRELYARLGNLGDSIVEP